MACAAADGAADPDLAELPSARDFNALAFHDQRIVRRVPRNPRDPDGSDRAGRRFCGWQDDPHRHHRRMRELSRRRPGTLRRGHGAGTREHQGLSHADQRHRVRELPQVDHDAGRLCRHHDGSYGTERPVELRQLPREQRGRSRLLRSGRKTGVAAGHLRHRDPRRRGRPQPPEHRRLLAMPCLDDQLHCEHRDAAESHSGGRGRVHELPHGHGRSVCAGQYGDEPHRFHREL